MAKFIVSTIAIMNSEMKLTVKEKNCFHALGTKNIPSERTNASLNKGAYMYYKQDE